MIGTRRLKLLTSTVSSGLEAVINRKQRERMAAEVPLRVRGSRHWTQSGTPITFALRGNAANSFLCVAPGETETVRGLSHLIADEAGLAEVNA
jgi:hypothetical protein